jgi:hypothetical protein
MPYLFGILMACVALGFFLQSRLYDMLRKRHPKVYESLGRPTLFLNNSIQNGLAVQGFILFGRFKQIDDPKLVRLCSFLRVFAICYLVFFACVVIYGFSSSQGNLTR